jgi:hypothetical protein
MIFALAGAAFCSGISDIPWTQSNFQRLKELTKTDVLNFLNQSGGTEGSAVAITDSEIEQFRWVDLAGDGKLELALIARSGPCCSALGLYWQDAPGKIRWETFVNAGDLKEAIRDLNGDGKDELIIWKEIAEPGSWAPSITTPRWPSVYRLENGKYVEDSRNFADFYDVEILPQLAQVEKAFEARRGRQDVGTLLETDKILRVLGRDPAAGLQQAYQWMNSGDPQRIQGAIAIFRDIGGHEGELRSAQAALKPAFERERAARQGD